MANLSLDKAHGPVAAAVASAERRPRAVLYAVLGLHLAVWTVLPILVCRNLQLDLAEDLALGKEWQLGYWKHPPLPWWLADLAYRIVPHPNVVYLLGPLSAVIAMYVTWRFAREVVAPMSALIAVLALEGIHYFTFSVPKFAHDHTLLVFWALAGWLYYRGIAHGRARDWMLAGACLALCFWSKYTAFAYAATLGLFLLFDPVARRAWRTPGPYLMALAFLVVLAPHLVWLIAADFPPFRYVEARAVAASRWYHVVTFPLQWTGSQMLALLPAIGLIAIACRRDGAAPPAGHSPAFARRCITALALGPFLFTTVVALALGRLPIAMWGFALWGFAPLAAVMWLHPDPQRLTAFTRAFVLVFVAMPVLYVGVELIEPVLRDRPKATQFPGRLLAETITRAWRERTGMPLRYVGGAEGVGTGPGEFAANNIAVYAPDRPRVIVHGNPVKSPWIDMADVARHGAVLVWQPQPGATGLPDSLRTTFPNAELQPPLILPRQTLRPVTPEVISYAFVLPQR